MGRRIVQTLLAVVLLALAAGGGVVAWAYAQFTGPGPLSLDTTLVIPRGSGLRDIAAQLSREGVIDSPLVFRLGARVMQAETALRAGEYVFPAKVSPRGVVELLQSGKTVVRRFTIAEGMTVEQILGQLADTEGLTGRVTDVPEEGWLLPETYHFSYGDERQAMVDRMVDAMHGLVDEMWPRRAEGLPLDDPEEAVILASIVERETGVPEERARVAAVFLNRLRKGMRLQSDPTVAYGVTEGEGGLDRPLTRDDLDTPTPYNTYIIDGLPPTAIANPGRAALEAVLHPARADDLYFVADGTGGHVFARTLEEHNANVRRWRKLRDEEAREAEEKAGDGG